MDLCGLVHPFRKLKAANPKDAVTEASPVSKDFDKSQGTHHPLQKSPKVPLTSNKIPLHQISQPPQNQDLVLQHNPLSFVPLKLTRSNHLSKCYLGLWSNRTVYLLIVQLSGRPTKYAQKASVVAYGSASKPLEGPSSGSNLSATLATLESNCLYLIQNNLQDFVKPLACSLVLSGTHVRAPREAHTTPGFSPGVMKSCRDSSADVFQQQSCQLHVILEESAGCTLECFLRRARTWTFLKPASVVPPASPLHPVFRKQGNRPQDSPLPPPSPPLQHVPEEAPDAACQTEPPQIFFKAISSDLCPPPEAPPPVIVDGRKGFGAVPPTQLQIPGPGSLSALSSKCSPTKSPLEAAAELREVCSPKPHPPADDSDSQAQGLQLADTASAVAESSLTKEDELSYDNRNLCIRDATDQATVKVIRGEERGATPQAALSSAGLKSITLPAEGKAAEGEEADFQENTHNGVRREDLEEEADAFWRGKEAPKANDLTTTSSPTRFSIFSRLFGVSSSREVPRDNDGDASISPFEKVYSKTPGHGHIIAATQTQPESTLETGIRWTHSAFRLCETKDGSCRITKAFEGLIRRRKSGCKSSNTRSRFRNQLHRESTDIGDFADDTGGTHTINCLAAQSCLPNVRGHALGSNNTGCLGALPYDLDCKSPGVAFESPFFSQSSQASIEVTEDRRRRLSGPPRGSQSFRTLPNQDSFVPRSRLPRPCDACLGVATAAGHGGGAVSGAGAAAGIPMSLSLKRNADGGFSQLWRTESTGEGDEGADEETTFSKFCRGGGVAGTPGAALPLGLPGGPLACASCASPSCCMCTCCTAAAWSAAAAAPPPTTFGTTRTSSSSGATSSRSTCTGQLPPGFRPPQPSVTDRAKLQFATASGSSYLAAVLLPPPPPVQTKDWTAAELLQRVDMLARLAVAAATMHRENIIHGGIQPDAIRFAAASPPPLQGGCSANPTRPVSFNGGVLGATTGSAVRPSQSLGGFWTSDVRGGNPGAFTGVLPVCESDTSSSGLALASLGIDELGRPRPPSTAYTSCGYVETYGSAAESYASSRCTAKTPSMGFFTTPASSLCDTDPRNESPQIGARRQFAAGYAPAVQGAGRFDFDKGSREGTGWPVYEGTEHHFHPHGDAQQYQYLLVAEAAARGLAWKPPSGAAAGSTREGKSSPLPSQGEIPLDFVEFPKLYPMLGLPGTALPLLHFVTYGKPALATTNRPDIVQAPPELLLPPLPPTAAVPTAGVVGGRCGGGGRPLGGSISWINSTGSSNVPSPLGMPTFGSRGSAASTYASSTFQPPLTSPFGHAAGAPPSTPTVSAAFVTGAYPASAAASLLSCTPFTRPPLVRNASMNDATTNNITHSNTSNLGGITEPVSGYNSFFFAKGHVGVAAVGLTPELPAPVPFEPKSHLNVVSPAIDSYMFGMLMWQVLTDSECLEHLDIVQLLAAKVQGRVIEHLPFSDTVPSKYVLLARRCLATDAAARPSMKIVASQLRELQKNLEAATSFVQKNYIAPDYVLPHHADARPPAALATTAALAAANGSNGSTTTAPLSSHVSVAANHRAPLRSASDQFRSNALRRSPSEPPCLTNGGAGLTPYDVGKGTPFGPSQCELSDMKISCYCGGLVFSGGYPCRCLRATAVLADRPEVMDPKRRLAASLAAGRMSLSSARAGLQPVPSVGTMTNLDLVDCLAEGNLYLSHDSLSFSRGSSGSLSILNMLDIAMDAEWGE